MKLSSFFVALIFLMSSLQLMAQEKGALTITIDSLKWKPIKNVTYKIGNLTIRDRYFMNKILVEEESTTDGELNGVQREFYEDGKIKSIKGYVYGVEVGTWQWFYPNGAVERKYEYDTFTAKDLTRKDIVDTSVHSSASSIDTLFIPQGKKRPTSCYFYHQDGTSEREEHFESDKRSGVWKYYALNGNLVKEEEYKDGKLLKSINH